jgi:hypothetical protein
MDSDAPRTRSVPHGYRTIWAPERVAQTIALALPGIVVSATITGVLLTFFLPTSVSVVAAGTVAAAVVVARLIAWTRFAGRRVVAVSDTHLAVRSGSRTVSELPWDAIASVTLERGSGVLRTMLDVLSDDADFPHVRAVPADVWDTRGALPTVLAVLPSEVRRLEEALAHECAVRLLPFTGGG